MLNGQFNIAYILLPLFSILVWFLIIKFLLKLRKQRKSPVLSARAKVISKRTRMDYNGDFPSTTDYYVTFEMENGVRMEFYIPGEVSGLLVEGDAGTLSYKGKKYLDFQRMIATTKER